MNQRRPPWLVSEVVFDPFCDRLRKAATEREYALRLDSVLWCGLTPERKLQAMKAALEAAQRVYPAGHSIPNRLRIALDQQSQQRKAA